MSCFNFQKFIFDFVNELLFSKIRYNSTAEKGRGERQELLFRDARGDDARHRQQRVPGVRHPRPGHVRHKAGDHPEHTPTGPGGHTGRGATGAQGAPHRRVRALCRVHRRARPLANEGPEGHQRRQPGAAGARERAPQAVLRPLLRHEHHQQRHRGDHTHPAANSEQLVQSSSVGARLLGLLNQQLYIYLFFIFSFIFNLFSKNLHIIYRLTSTSFFIKLFILNIL